MSGLGRLGPLWDVPYGHRPLPSPRWWHVASQRANFFPRNALSISVFLPFPPQGLPSLCLVPRWPCLRRCRWVLKMKLNGLWQRWEATSALGQLQVHLEGMTPWEDRRHLRMGVWSSVLGRGAPSPIRPGDSLWPRGQRVGGMTVLGPRLSAFKIAKGSSPQNLKC